MSRGTTLRSAMAYERPPGVTQRRRARLRLYVSSLIVRADDRGLRSIARCSQYAVLSSSTRYSTQSRGTWARAHSPARDSGSVMVGWITGCDRVRRTIAGRATPAATIATSAQAAIGPRRGVASADRTRSVVRKASPIQHQASATVMAAAIAWG